MYLKSTRYTGWLGFYLTMACLEIQESQVSFCVIFESHNQFQYAVVYIANNVSQVTIPQKFLIINFNEQHVM